MAREIEEALAAWRDAVRRLEEVLAGHDSIESQGAIDAEVAHLRERFHGLSAEQNGRLNEAPSRYALPDRAG